MCISHGLPYACWILYLFKKQNPTADVLIKYHHEAVMVPLRTFLDEIKNTGCCLNDMMCCDFS